MIKLRFSYRFRYQIFFQVVNVIYYTIAFVNDFISSNSLKKARDLIFGSLALPLALETSLMYWVMTSIDRELVFPKALDDFFPLWHDILIHTNVSIFILIDLFLVEHTYPRRSSAIRVLITFLLCYLIWLYVVFINTGRWVYAVIGVLSAPQRIIFFVACGLVTVGIYFIGETMNTFLSGRNLVNEKKKKK